MKKTRQSPDSAETTPQNPDASLIPDELEEGQDSFSFARYSTEIKIGLGVIGLLGFILAAVAAYRLVNLGREEAAHASPGASQSSPQEATKATKATNESPSGSADRSVEASSDASQQTFSSSSIQSQQGTANTEGNLTQKQPELSISQPANPSGEPPNLNGFIIPDQSPSEATTATAGPLDFAAIPAADPIGSPGTAQSTGEVPSGGDPTAAGGQEPYSSGQNVSAQNTPDGIGNSGTLGGVRNNASNASAFRGGASADFYQPDVHGSESPTQATPAVPSSYQSPQVNPAAPDFSGNAGNSTQTQSFPGDFFAGAAPRSSIDTPAATAPSRLSPTGTGSPASISDPPSGRTIQNDVGIPTGGSSQSGFQSPNPPFGTDSPTGMAMSGTAASPVAVAQPTAASSRGGSPYSPPLVARNSATPQAAEASPGTVPYTVQQGETLFDIARERLGKASRWVEIYELNRAVLGERMEFFRPGLTLQIPTATTNAGVVPAQNSW